MKATEQRVDPEYHQVKGDHNLVVSKYFEWFTGAAQLRDKPPRKVMTLTLFSPRLFPFTRSEAIEAPEQTNLKTWPPALQVLCRV
jgi:hypothetical protein